MDDLSFMELPKSIIGEIKNNIIKNFYDQFSFYLLSSCSIDKFSEDKIKKFIQNSFKRFKVIVYTLPEKKTKKQINLDQLNMVKFDISTVVCVEKKCFIIESVNNDLILQIFENINSVKINVQSLSESETVFLYFYLKDKEEFTNNYFVKNTISTVSKFLIQRFFHPSFFFEDSRFFFYKEEPKTPEEEFKAEFKEFLKSKSIEELRIDDILKIFEAKYTKQPQIEHFSEDDFIKINTVYAGDHHICYLVMHIKTLHIFLMKYFSNSILDKYQKREIEFLTKHSHQCFIKCYGLLKNKKNEIIGIIYGYMSNGSLYKFFEKFKNKITPLFSIMMMVRVFQVLRYLNRKGIVLRDLKPSNILINHDFVPYISDLESFYDTNTSEEFTEDIGAISYMSPEQFIGQKLTCQSDIYSFGLVVYFLFEHKILFTNYKQRNDFIKELKKPKMTNSSEIIQEICCRCLKTDPNDRIKCDELENIICDKIIPTNHFKLYFTKEKSQEIIESEIGLYLFENIMILSQHNSKWKSQEKIDFAHDMYLFDLIKQYFYKMYYSICNELAEIDKYMSSALNNLGNLFYCGIGVEQNYLTAKNFYLLASKMNNSISLNYLGDMYRKGIGVKQDYTEAIKFYELAIKQNNSESLYILGYLYYNGYGVEKSVLKAKEYFEKSANLNNTHGLNALGYLYVAGIGIKQDFNKAKKYYKKALELGNFNSCMNLAFLYIEGLGSIKDYSKAAFYIQLAVDKKSDSGYFHLGKLYKHGYHYKQNLDKARECFEKAEELGNIDAVNSLGNLYFKGIGVKKDYVKARMYYLKASYHQKRNSLFKLGVIYENGLGVEPNYIRAIEYYEKAANEGYLSAYNILGNIFLNGEYFEIDEEKAINYLMKNLESKGESYQYERNGFYHIRNNFSYYPSFNDIGLIYLFRNEQKLAIKYIREAAHNEYQFGQNCYALLFDPSLNEYNTKEERISSFDKAEYYYLKACQKNFALAEYNYGHMLEENGESEKAFEYYEKVSVDENKELIFHEKIRIDKRLNISISFISLYVNCRLFLRYVDSNKEKAKEYFLKIIKKIRNENEIKYFPFVRDLFLQLHLIEYKQTELNQNYFFDKEQIERAKYNRNIVNRNQSQVNFILEKDPADFFEIIYEFLINRKKFVMKVRDVVNIMKEKLYNSPYHILFGRIPISNYYIQQKRNKLKDINQLFYEAFEFIKDSEI